MFWGGGAGSAGVVWLFPWDAPCLGFFGAPDSVQQVEICAVLVTRVPAAEAV